MNINHGWKIHGDLVADLTIEEAYAQMGLQLKTTGGLEIVDQKAFGAFTSRLSKIGIDLDPSVASGSALPKYSREFADAFMISNKVESLGRGPSSMVNDRPMIGIENLKHSYSNPLDTLSMMEVFHENNTQYKASSIYGQGRSFTGYAQTIENRDKIITDLEQRLGDRLQDVDQKILGGHQTEGATQLSKKITGRFTTEYTDIPSVGGVMDWFSQNPGGLKGQDAIDNVMATNPEMRPYIHTGVIDDQSAANLQKLTDDFPVFNEMLHGPNGYISPYGTIEDSFSQQGYDYKTGKSITPPTATTTPVNPTTPQSAVATETYDHAVDASKAAATGEPLAESPPPKSRRTGPADVGRQTNVRTSPAPKGTSPSAPKITPQGQPKPKPPNASVTTNAPKTSPSPSPISSGAPTKARNALDNAAETARNVAKGHGNARTLGILGAAALLGVGVASTRSKKSVPQDQGTYIDESRRRLGY